MTECSARARSTRSLGACGGACIYLSYSEEMMKRVCANFIIYDIRTNIHSPVDDGHWGRFTNPGHENQALFTLNDDNGEIELIVMHWKAFGIKVFGEVPDEVIDNPDPDNLAHQDAIIDFYVRAFTALNNLISQYRFRVFDYQNQPIKWRAYRWLDTQTGRKTRQFYIRPPIEIRVSWTVDDTLSEQPEKVKLNVYIHRGGIIRGLSIPTRNSRIDI
jgi:hypothetical protein